jgi:threonine synthase
MKCGGIYEISCQEDFSLDQIQDDLPGIWRFQHSFCLPADAPAVSLGEGNTPLIWAEAFGQNVAFKLEFLNPTGSFKDRGTSPLISFLLARGITEAVEDSSGNAGASFAAYASAAGISAKIFVPAHASGPKQAQIAAYGAEVILVPGSRSKTAEVVMRIAQEGVVYASHVYMPHDVLGYATIAYELFEQLGGVPGTVVAPAGQGSLLLGIGRGFDALRRADLISRVPVLVGVQAAACAPLWTAFNQGSTIRPDAIDEKETLAEGVRARNPVRGKIILELVRSTGGRFVVVEEQNILPGRDQLAYRGLFVEPTSAIVWNGLSQIIEEVPEPIVVILTGSGLKAYHED